MSPPHPLSPVLRIRADFCAHSPLCYPIPSHPGVNLLVACLMSLVVLLNLLVLVREMSRQTSSNGKQCLAAVKSEFLERNRRRNGCLVFSVLFLKNLDQPIAKPAGRFVFLCFLSFGLFRAGGAAGPKGGGRAVGWQQCGAQGAIPLRRGLFCFQISLIGIFPPPPRILSPYRGTGMGTAGQRAR